MAQDRNPILVLRWGREDAGDFVTFGIGKNQWPLHEEHCSRALARGRGPGVS
jgi:hypothetical protein